MSRSLTYLRRGILGITFTGAMAFGAAQAFATPDQALQSGSCRITYRKYIPLEGCSECPQGGYCSGISTRCVCFDLGPS